MEGATVRVALASFSSYWPSKASYQCVLGSALSSTRARRYSNTSYSNRTKISEISLTPNTSAPFSAKVNRSWGSSVFIRCFSNQPELQCEEKEISTNISVFYKAEATIEPLSNPLCSGSTACFRLSFTKHGNPPARFGDCTISGRLLQSSDTGNDQRKIELTSDDSGRFISCQMLQNFSGDKEDVSYFNSSRLHVEEKPVSTWTAKHPLAVWEGEVLSVNVSSVGRSPASISHECGLMLGLKSISRVSHPGGTTEFNAKVDRSMHGSVLTCTVTHPCLNQSEQHFAQNVSVFYSPTVEFTGINNNLVSVSVSKGNPQPKVVCWKAFSENSDNSKSTLIEVVQAESQKNLTIEDKDCAVHDRIWISCRVNQTVDAKKVLNYSKHQFVCSKATDSGAASSPIQQIVITGITATAALGVTALIVALCLLRVLRKPKTACHKNAAGAVQMAPSASRASQILHVAPDLPSRSAKRVKSTKQVSFASRPSHILPGTPAKPAKVNKRNNQASPASATSPVNSASPALSSVSEPESGDVYARVVQSPNGVSNPCPDRSDSSLTLYTDIVGHLDTDGQTFVSCDSEGQIVYRQLNRSK